MPAGKDTGLPGHLVGFLLVKRHVAGHAFAFAILFNIVVEAVKVISGHASGQVKGHILNGRIVVIKIFLSNSRGEHDQSPFYLRIFHLEIL